MDVNILLIQAASGALGGNIGGVLRKPEIGSSTVLNSIVGAIGGLVAAHFGGGVVGQARSNIEGGHAGIAGIAGLVTTLIVNSIIDSRIKPI